MILQPLKCLTENKNSFSHWIEKHVEVTAAPSSRGLSDVVPTRCPLQPCQSFVA